jgi:hypothetical protein
MCTHLPCFYNKKGKKHKPQKHLCNKLFKKHIYLYRVNISPFFA